MDPDRLLEEARGAADRAIAPYSSYHVGAAIVTGDGETYAGCNLEVANYSNSIHAEELAIARALFDGARRFDALAVASGEGTGPTPCGSCRQTLVEFCDPSLSVYVDRDGEYDAYRLGELLPAAFTSEAL